MKNVKLTSIACVIALTGCQGINMADSCELCDAERKAKIEQMLKSQNESSASSDNASSSGSSYSY